MSPNQDISNNAFSRNYQNKVFFYFVLVFVVLLVILKLPMAQIYYDTVSALITFAPMIVILVMAGISFWKGRQYPEYQGIIRRFYLTFTLKFLTAILIFYIFYSPSLFSDSFRALFRYLRTIFTLEGMYFLSGYFLTIVIGLAVVFVAFRAYQKSQDKYLGSIRQLIRRTLYVVFAISFLVFVSSAAAYPAAYAPLTDTLGDAIYTLSSGSLKFFKGDDQAAYARIDSLKSFTSKISKSLSETSQNLSNDKQEFKASLDLASQDLKTSIVTSSQILSDKIKEDLSGKLETAGGTLDGSLVIKGEDADLTVEGTTTTRDIIPDEALTYNLGKSDRSWNELYVHRLLGASPVFIGNNSSNQGLTNDGDLVVSNSLEVQGAIYASSLEVNGAYVLPTVDGTVGQMIQTDGTGTLSWATGGGAPGGLDGQLQFNNGGVFGGDADFSWNNTDSLLSVIGNVGIGTAADANYALKVAGSGHIKLEGASPNGYGLIKKENNNVGIEYYDLSDNVLTQLNLGDNYLYVTVPGSSLELSSNYMDVSIGSPADGAGNVSAFGFSADYSALNTAGDGYSAFNINVTDAQAGADGDRYLMNLKLGGVSKFAVDSEGNVYQSGVLRVGSQWTTSGSDIYYNTGSVGIGTATPESKLTVYDAASAEMRLSNGTDQYSRLSRDSSDNLTLHNQYSSTSDHYTSILLHADSNFADSSVVPHTITANGNAQISAVASKFGGASAYFDGTGDYLTTTDSAYLDFQAGDFTMDMWVNPSSTAGFQRLLGAGAIDGGANNAWFLGLGDGWGGGVKFNFGYYNGSGYTESTSSALTVVAGNWYHVAVVRSGATLTYYLDGVSMGTMNLGVAAINSGATGVIVGSRYNLNVGDVIEPFNGYIDELRISKGVARWSAGFTPPAAPYDNLSNAYTEADVLSAGSTGIVLGDGALALQMKGSVQSFFVATEEKMRLAANGNLGLGDTTPDTTLKVVGSICAKADGDACFGSTAGNIYATNFIVDGTTHLPDYVFEPDYPLMPLPELKTYLTINKHLPGVPSAGEVTDTGLNLSVMVPAILEKTEENTLYILGMSDQIQSLNLKTDQDVTTLQGLQMSVDEKLGVVQSSITGLNDRSEAVDGELAFLSTRSDAVEARLTDAESLIDTLQVQVAELRGRLNEETNLAQIDLSAQDITFIKLLLGIDRVANPGDVDILGHLSSKTLATGGLEIIALDLLSPTIGTAIILPADGTNDGKSVMVQTGAVTAESKIFATPNRPVQIGVTGVIVGESFLIETSEVLAEELKVDWWIIGTDNGQ